IEELKEHEEYIKNMKKKSDVTIH
ncbi:uncharacterized protein METZ01_LOCUS227961, partial [marine metagenome]